MNLAMPQSSTLTQSRLHRYKHKEAQKHEHFHSKKEFRSQEIQQKGKEYREREEKIIGMFKSMVPSNNN